MESNSENETTVESTETITKAPRKRAPRRATTSSAAQKAAEEAVTEQPAQTGDAAADGASEAQEATQKPAPRKRAPRRASAKTEAAAVDSSESHEATEPAPAEESVEQEPKKPARARARKATAKPKSEADAAESEASEADAPELSEPKVSSENEQAEESGASSRSRSRSRSRNRNRGNGNGNGNGDAEQANHAQRNQSDEDANDRSRQRNNKRRNGSQDEFEQEISEEDVLIPVAGILDILDNYAFVRTGGYLASVTDVYVSLGQVKKYNLRKGDAVVGAIRQPREGEQNSRQKYNALVKVDSINGLSPEDAGTRTEYSEFTPLYPQERLRMETQAGNYTQRMIDLFTPIGKGQRGLIAGPPKSGKSTIIRNIAEAIAQNNPETHLMVVLVDERPEEVTELQRAVRGEVISSTFDRAVEDHITVVELAVERAKRLVELGRDVVVLVDSITQLGRAYISAAPTGGRGISGASDVAALSPIKRIFGAARNIENGGSLTILATVSTKTGSSVDDLIFSEVSGTENLELRLDRKIANRRIFPAVDICASATRREDTLLSADEVMLAAKIRGVLAEMSEQQALEAILAKLAETGSNVEFLVQMQRDLPKLAVAASAQSRR